MKRFSQRNSLVTLNEINITPLLDLAFVLLLIFIITRPLLEQSLPLQLPKGGVAGEKITAKDKQTVEVSVSGAYRLNGRAMTLDQIEKVLVQVVRANPNTVVIIRVDENGLNKHSLAVLDRCQRRGITRFSFPTRPNQK
ncbi:MAG: biopolymer transporter ExbD [Verrucomicrobiota bacterium]|nr:biopolymer transporter ExbD [Verrucomicrobiota bacterium]